MATEAERKAGYEVAIVDVIALAKQFVPGMFEYQVEQKIKANPSLVQKVVDDILEEAEKARGGH